MLIPEKESELCISKKENEDLKSLQIGVKRPRFQMEADTFALEVSERKGKRIKCNYSEEIQDFSKIISANLNDDLENFEDWIINFQESSMEIENFDEVYESRKNYTNHYIKSMLEMMKHGIQEDFYNK